TRLHDMTEEALLALVESADAGDVAQRRQLFASLYDELHRMAQRELRRNSHATLSPTTLLHETFLNICERETAPAVDRGRFMVRVARHAWADPQLPARSPGAEARRSVRDHVVVHGAAR